MDRKKITEELSKELFKKLKIYSENNNSFMTERDCMVIAQFSSKICIGQSEEREKDKERQYCQVCGKDITDIDNQLFCEKCIKPNTH